MPNPKNKEGYWSNVHSLLEVELVPSNFRNGVNIEHGEWFDRDVPELRMPLEESCLCFNKQNGLFSI